MEICQIKPYTSIGDYFVPFFLLLVDINVVLIYRQQQLILKFHLEKSSSEPCTTS
jgi:hypothetical protein